MKGLSGIALSFLHLTQLPSIRPITPQQLGIQYCCLMIASMFSLSTCKLSWCTFLVINRVKGWSLNNIIWCLPSFGIFACLILPPTLIRPSSKMGFRPISFEVDGIGFEDDIQLYSFRNDSNWVCRKRIILLWLISAVVRNLKCSLFSVQLFHFIQFSFGLSIQWKVVGQCYEQRVVVSVDTY